MRRHSHLTLQIRRGETDGTAWLRLARELSRTGLEMVCPEEGQLPGLLAAWRRCPREQSLRGAFQHLTGLRPTRGRNRVFPCWWRESGRLGWEEDRPFDEASGLPIEVGWEGRRCTFYLVPAANLWSRSGGEESFLGLSDPFYLAAPLFGGIEISGGVGGPRGAPCRVVVDEDRIRELGTAYCRGDLWHRVIEARPPAVPGAPTGEPRTPRAPSRTSWFERRSSPRGVPRVDLRRSRSAGHGEPSTLLGRVAWTLSGLPLALLLLIGVMVYEQVLTWRTARPPPELPPRPRGAAP
jgi:hypothetical protein